MLAAASLPLTVAGEASAQPVIVAEYCPPTVAYYQPVVPTVAYSLPSVTYYTPRVAYYPVQSVSYFAPPVASYYVPPAVYYPGAVGTTRYGVFGQPRETRMYYPTYVLPR
jgi:hypothetical protein